MILPWSVWKFYKDEKGKMLALWDSPTGQQKENVTESQLLSLQEQNPHFLIAQAEISFSISHQDT